MGETTSSQQYRQFTLCDQYGFKLTSNTTTALADLTNRISVELEDVRCLLIDFRKEFDSVDHLTLIVKLNKKDKHRSWHTAKCNML